MLDMGFEPQLKAVFTGLPAVRQTLLFTATWPETVRKLAASYMREDPVNIFVGGGVDAELSANTSVEQQFVHATDDEKDKKLYDLLCGLDENARVIAFANTKRRCEYLAKLFWDEGFGSCAIHGDRTQAEREKALSAFSKKESPLMFATSVASRGLDLPSVTHVINFDMARDVDEYIHRIGRTGRAGATGKAITFWNPDYDKECSPALIKIARDAGQHVPDWLLKHQGTKATKLWQPKSIDVQPSA
jgi:superfamily II DNA/RNA helicase